MSDEDARLRCGCGSVFSMTRRGNATRIAEGRDAICPECRFPLVIVVTPELVDWWRWEGFTPESALPLAEAVFGPRDSWVSDRIEIPLSGDTAEPGFAAIVA